MAARLREACDAAFASRPREHDSDEKTSIAISAVKTKVGVESEGGQKSSGFVEIMISQSEVSLQWLARNEKSFAEPLAKLAVALKLTYEAPPAIPELCSRSFGRQVSRRA